MNLVLVYADDITWDYLDGMPYLASEPEGSWVTFPNATHTTPICGPSRSTLMTGLYATHHHNSNNEYGHERIDGGWDSARMYAPALTRAGVYSSFLGKYINGWPWFSQGAPVDYRPQGWGWWRSASLASYVDFQVTKNIGGRDHFTDVYRIDVESDMAEEFAETAPEPFHLVWASFAPHPGSDPDQYMPAPRHQDIPVTLQRLPSYDEPDPGFLTKPQWLRDERPTPLSSGQKSAWDEDHVEAIRMLRSLDEGVERLIEALKARGILDRTVIVFAGDNMNCYGEHRHFGKGVPWELSVNMGLRVRWPGHPGGVNDAIVSNIDLAPTMLDLAGPRARMTYAPDGMSIVPLLDGTLTADQFRDEILLVRDEETDPESFSGGPTFRGLRTRTHKYVEYGGYGLGQRELYDLTADPGELDNLAGVSAHADTQADLAARLARILAESDPAPPALQP